MSLQLFKIKTVLNWKKKKRKVENIESYHLQPVTVA